MNRPTPDIAHTSLRKTQRQAIASTSTILSLLNALIAYTACFIANNAFNIPLSYVVVPFIFFISLEALYAREIETRILKNYGHTTAFRLAEILILSILLRLLLLLVGSEGSRLAAFVAQLETPLAAYFCPEYNTALVLLLLVWGFCLVNLKDMQSIFNLDERVSWDQIGKEQANLVKTRQGFVQRFLFLGLAVLTGMFLSVSTWGTGDRIAVEYHGTPPLLIAVMLLYFFLVLLLMSQTQLARLRTRWWLNESVVHPLLGKRWLQVSLIFFATLSLAVLLLPTGFGEDLLAILQVILLYLAMLGQALLALLIVPLAFLFPWLNVQPQGNEITEDIPIAPTPTPEITPGRVPPAWLDQVGDIFFWAVLGLVLGFAVFQYLRQDRSLLQDVRTLFRKIGEWLSMLWHSITGRWQTLQTEFQRHTRRQVRGTQVMGETGSKVGGSPVPSIDQPRLRIFQLYQSLLQWGAEHGIARKPYQTPLAYEDQLEANVQESEVVSPIRTLTDRFDEARYSKRIITEDEANQIAREWEKTRKI